MFFGVILSDSEGSRTLKYYTGGKTFTVAQDGINLLLFFFALFLRASRTNFLVL